MIIAQVREKYRPSMADRSLRLSRDTFFQSLWIELKTTFGRLGFLFCGVCPSRRRLQFCTNGASPHLSPAPATQSSSL